MIRKFAKQSIANVFKPSNLDFIFQNKQIITALFLKNSKRLFNTEKKQSKEGNQATSDYGNTGNVQIFLNDLKKQEHTSIHQQQSITPDTKNQNKKTKLPNDSKNQPFIVMDPTGSNKKQNSLNNQNNQNSINKQQDSPGTQNLKGQVNNTNSSINPKDENNSKNQPLIIKNLTGPNKTQDSPTHQNNQKSINQQQVSSGTQNLKIDVNDRNSSNSLKSEENYILKNLKRIIIQSSKRRISISDILKIIVGAIAGVFCLHQYNKAYDQDNNQDDQGNEIKINNNLLLQKFGKKPLNVISYYNQNNSTQEQFKKIFESLSDQKTSIVTGKFFVILGESGMGKTTSLHKLITQKRSSQNICYINLQQKTNVKTIFQLIQAIKSSNKTLQKAKSYTLIIDDINYLTKLPDINNQKDIFALILQIVYSCRKNKIKLCMISSQRNFYQTLKRQNMLQRLRHNFIQIQPKPQNQVKQCIQNMLQYYSDKCTQFKLIQQQSLKIKNHFIQQGYSLEIVQLLITDMITKLKHKFQNKEGKINSFSILEECQETLKTVQQETIESLELNREGSFKSIHKKIIFQALLTNNEKEKLNINRDYYSKKKKFSTNCKRIEYVISQKIKQLSKNKIQNIKPEQAYLNSLEQKKFLVDCCPRSKFIVNLFKEYQSNL